jgi:hypothetical protein
MAPGKVWFALTRRSTLHSSAEIALRQGAHYVTVFKQGSRVAACKGSYRTGKLKAIKSREGWDLNILTGSLSAIVLLQSIGGQTHADFVHTMQTMQTFQTLQDHRKQNFRVSIQRGGGCNKTD